MRVEAFLTSQSKLFPSATAIVTGPERLSYADLDRLSQRLAAALRAKGVRPGARIALFMDNIQEMAVAIFAGLKAGATVVPVNPGVKSDGLAHVLADCTPSVLIHEARHARVCTEAQNKAGYSPPCIVARATESMQHDSVAFEACLALEAPLPDPLEDEDQLAFVIYTSGSSGRPKGVMLSHRNVDAASAMIGDYLENDETDIVLSALPLSFTYGLYQLLVAVRSGATLVLEKSFAFPHAVLEKARNERVTGFPMVPTMAAMLAGLDGLAAGSLPSLRYITNASGPLPPAHSKALRRLFPEARLYSMYGLTECARATFLDPEEIDRHPCSVGKALPGTEALVLDESGSEAETNAPGELVIRGPHVMQGYWNNPEATANTLRRGPDGVGRYLHTGDIFSRDENGLLHFIGRRDEVVKIRGEKVSPKQVETVLTDCPGVCEALAFTKPDPIDGHRLEALIVRADPELSEQTIARHCKRHLPDTMMPKAFIFRAELPKSANGKINRRHAAIEALKAS
ncbi:AMP-binding protein [Nitratireductor sp. GISD-1A_MAKvit]|uniref:class I adenylate-forming enzyme family protein n=1 Tax=Nitratireductor sp. GISD-1A_MAKvit TaxID=3234198 RepID=UPI0034675554